MFFPKLFPEDDDLNYYAHVKNKILALTDLTNNDKNILLAAELKLKSIDVYFMDLMVPDIFTSNNPNNIVVLYENGFQNMCAAIESIGTSTQGLTLLQLYAKLNYYKETNGPKNEDDNN